MLLGAGESADILRMPKAVGAKTKSADLSDPSHPGT